MRLRLCSIIVVLLTPSVAIAAVTQSVESDRYAVRWLEAVRHPERILDYDHQFEVHDLDRERRHLLTIALDERDIEKLFLFEDRLIVQTWDHADVFTIVDLVSCPRSNLNNMSAVVGYSSSHLRGIGVKKEERMRTGRPKSRLQLTTQEREQLQAWNRSRSLPQGIAYRIRIVLMADQGRNNAEIANELRLSQATVGKWRQRFVQHRVEGLHDEIRPGRPRSVSDEKVAELLHKTLHSQPEKATHWSCRDMARETEISKSTVQRIWSTFGVKPHRFDTFKLSTDPFFVEKVRDIVGLYLNPPTEALVLCVDEKSQCQALERTQPALPMGFGYLEGYTHDYLRHGTTTLFAALDVASGQVIAQCKKRHRHQEFLQFLRHIDANVPAQFDVHLIVDNYGTHKHEKVRRWQARHPRFHMHFTPTYSSWLNQVEIWFGIITKRAIRRGSFGSVKQLVQSIDQFVRSYNKDSKPFAWTATADSIFEKLGRLCEVISGTGH